MNTIGIAGTGAMGTGIAQVAVLSGFEVCMFDSNEIALENARQLLYGNIQKLLHKEKITPVEAKGAEGRLYFFSDIKGLKDSELIIEAIIENKDIKKELFQSLEKNISEKCILASNTSSISISSLAAGLTNPDRFIGIHFFNPPFLMHLVEIIPAVQSNPETTKKAEQFVQQIGKVGVLVKDSPGFIVNKVARPFYSEALKIYEEGMASCAQIDQTMKSYGFKMGPFELMDFIGHDVNYAVTRSVWEAFYYDSRYKPSHTQMRLVEAGYLGRKSGKGFYDYSTQKEPFVNLTENYRNEEIFLRIITMLINEAADTVYYGICNEKDVELAMTIGVNYPKGLLAWGEELGWKFVSQNLEALFTYYQDSRYRVSPYIRQRI